MPQMSPMMWFSLYLYFLFSFVLMMSLIYFFLVFIFVKKVELSNYNKLVYNLLW